MNTTSNPSTIHGLGINPGLAHEFADISIEPIKFTMESNLGWGVEWRANHRAVSKTTGKIVEVNGHAFSTTGQRNLSGSKLLTIWNERMEERAENRV